MRSSQIGGGLVVSKKSPGTGGRSEKTRSYNYKESPPQETEAILRVCYSGTACVYVDR